MKTFNKILKSFSLNKNNNTNNKKFVMKLWRENLNTRWSFVFFFFFIRS